jgi:hypothetical protein
MRGSKEEQETENVQEKMKKPRRLSFPFFQLFLELFLAEEAEEEEDDGDGDEDESGIYIYCGLNMSLN